MISFVDAKSNDRLVSARKLTRNDKGQVTNAGSEVKQLIMSGELRFTDEVQAMRTMSGPDAAIELSAWADPIKTRCDELAGSPLDPRALYGVKLEDIDVVRASQACNAAVQQVPFHPRYAYQRGRILLRQKQYAAARAEIERAAQGGYPAAFHSLGVLSKDGLGAPVDLTKARKYFDWAARGGVSESELAIALMHLSATMSPSDNTEALRWIRLSVEHGNANGKLALAWAYRQGSLGLAKNDAEAFKLYGAALRNPVDQTGNATYVLGSMYEAGTGTDSSLPQAVTWYRRSAELGNPHGQAALGRMLFLGSGTKGDAVESAKWLALAAENDVSEAQVFLGYQYLKGIGVSANHAQALNWLGRAANSGNFDGMYWLGVAHIDASAGKTDTAIGIKWLERAASLSDQSRIHLALGVGHFKQREFGSATKWLERAAPYEGRAQLLLGQMSETGLGSAPNEALAERYYQSAARSSDAGTQAAGLAGVKRIEAARTERQSTISPALTPGEVIVAAIISGLGMWLLSEAVSAKSDPESDAATNKATARQRQQEDIEEYNKSVRDSTLRQERIGARFVCSSKGGHFFEGTGNYVGTCSK